MHAQSPRRALCHLPPETLSLIASFASTRCALRLALTCRATRCVLHAPGAWNRLDFADMRERLDDAAVEQFVDFAAHWAAGSGTPNTTDTHTHARTRDDARALVTLRITHLVMDGTCVSEWTAFWALSLPALQHLAMRDCAFVDTATVARVLRKRTWRRFPHPSSTWDTNSTPHPCPPSRTPLRVLLLPSLMNDGTSRPLLTIVSFHKDARAVFPSLVSISPALCIRCGSAETAMDYSGGRGWPQGARAAQDAATTCAWCMWNLVCHSCGVYKGGAGGGQSTPAESGQKTCAACNVSAYWCTPCARAWRTCGDASCKAHVCGACSPTFRPCGVCGASICARGAYASDGCWLPHSCPRHCVECRPPVGVTCCTVCETRLCPTCLPGAQICLRHQAADLDSLDGDDEGERDDGDAGGDGGGHASDSSG
ncbi:hypothetical protein M427DRAFT_346398 [Gonapodya prolifera JEL478]|uniref:F-box domain-containing protein n=1 Tax=Gonapodya prolifera (strain JEL478) TaxID=1344416 RepID=A0A139AVT1_GONPJ|nr:hypothetical protein M427DRAFT_346398 [Gonapodya prolifera JEL478]|eukprot:KXS20842.1 hypothetical protein M427DRAFT_346398 [Gonapodya prolifera JEL478]